MKRKPPSQNPETETSRHVSTMTLWVKPVEKDVMFTVSVIEDASAADLRTAICDGLRRCGLNGDVLRILFVSAVGEVVPWSPNSAASSSTPMKIAPFIQFNSAANPVLFEQPG
jgi:hypothetical protein